MQFRHKMLVGAAAAALPLQSAQANEICSGVDDILGTVEQSLAQFRDGRIRERRYEYNSTVQLPNATICSVESNRVYGNKFRCHWRLAKEEEAKATFSTTRDALLQCPSLADYKTLEPVEHAVWRVTDAIDFNVGESISAGLQLRFYPQGLYVSDARGKRYRTGHFYVLEFMISSVR